ncbi:uncharacterized protein LOC141659790 [Apium graveolens]|uniref:uncharacterized protein LOC141659790 n=1 Tax=Apium graveolens TaxID=4045 RepID=UPI003D7956F9
MDKQRNETKRLNHESTSGKPTNVPKFFLEDDAAELYTREIFYKVQGEIVAARDDMRIQTIGPEINDIKCYEMRDVKMKDMIFKVEVSKTYANCSCKKFLLCGILCRHVFCALNHFEVFKIPRRLLLNRWMKNAESKPSSQVAVSNEVLNMEIVSAEVTNIWFNFPKCVSKVGSDLTKLELVRKTITDLHSSLGDDDSVSTKKDFLATLIGKQPDGEITIHPPLQCKNKSSGLKRLLSEREKAIVKAKKRKRQCSLCLSYVHNKRGCPKKEQFAACPKKKKRLAV